MEALRNLQASLAQFHEQKFEQAEAHLKGLLAEQDTGNNEIQKARLEERDREYSTLNQEFESRGAKIKELEGKLQDLDKWHERALEVETLREDNAELQRELEVLKSGSRAIPEDNGHKELLRQIKDRNPDSVIRDFPAEHGVPDTIPYASYTELAERYRNLFREMGILAGAFTRLSAQHRSCKDTIRSWHNLLDKETFVIPVKGKPITFRRVGNDETRNFGQSQLGGTAAAIDREPTSRRDLEKPDAPGTFTEQRSEEEADPDNANIPPQLPQPPLPASIAAINRRSPSPPIKIELKDNDNGEAQDIPGSTLASTLDVDSNNVDNGEIPGNTPNTATATVSRFLKRKQHPGQSEEIPTLNSSGYFPACSSKKPVTVKSEQESSSPLQNLMQQRELNNLDTQDLDEIDNSVQTPRKKNAHSPFNVTNLPFSILPDEDSSNSIRRTHSGRQLGDQRAEDKPNHAAALQPKDCNANVVRRPAAGDLGHDGKRRRGDRRGAEAIPIITEDGEDDLYKGTRKGPGGPRKARESARLNDLLEAPSSPKMALTPRPPPKSAGAKASVNPDRPPRDPNGYGQLSLVTPSKPALSKTSASARQAISTDTFDGALKKPDHRRVSADNMRFNFSHGADRTPRDGEPYRSRTVDRLSLDNFRINPDRNEGVDYAFDDVVRKRDQRQCLPGCTRPDCCGSRFRAMAKVGGLRALPGRESIDEDQEILENYLGDQKYRLEAMNEDERLTLLIDAKAEALAARYGRHRYAHERHHSPPGFWRADMPSTQELEEDREEARRMEKEKVESRYREAMRPGGMWKFADE